MTLFDRDESPVAAIGRPLPPPEGKRRGLTMTHSDQGPTSYLHLADGRWLAANVPTILKSHDFRHHGAPLAG